MSKGKIAVIATLDSKGAEAMFVHRQLTDLGKETLLIDIGTRGSPAIQADYTRDEVKKLSGIAGATSPGSPAEELAAMGRGARIAIEGMFQAGELDGLLGIGGGKGSAAFFRAVEGLPYGFPRLLVSSARPAMLAEFAAQADIVLYPTLVDMLGLNRFTRRVLRNAARAIAMMEYEASDSGAAKSIAVTAFGVTTAAANAIKAGLEAHGIEVIVFPANGAGGRAMEAMVKNGTFDAVIDLTTTEMADLLIGGTASAGETRLTAAGARGIPQLIAPGAVDMVNFNAPDTIPETFAERRFYQHTPHTTLMRTDVNENRMIGEETARRLNQATGPVTIFWPAKGVSDYDMQGMSFFDPEADLAWREAVFEAVAPSIETVDIDCHINDPAFADACIGWGLRALGKDSQA